MENGKPNPFPLDNFAYPLTVCHRTITGDSAYYPQAEFHSQTIYFCTETCKGVFRFDPEHFYAAHSKRRL
jgi:YHS domain-containing protein